MKILTGLIQFPLASNQMLQLHILFLYDFFGVLIYLFVTQNLIATIFEFHY